VPEVDGSTVPHRRAEVRHAALGAGDICRPAQSVATQRWISEVLHRQIGTTHKLQYGQFDDAPNQLSHQQEFQEIRPQRV